MTVEYASTAAVGIGGTDSWRRGRCNRRADAGNSLAITQPREKSRNSVPVVGDGAAHTSTASANLIASITRRGDQARSGALLPTLSSRLGGTVRKRCIVMMGVQRVCSVQRVHKCLKLGKTTYARWLAMRFDVFHSDSAPEQVAAANEQVQKV